MTDEIRRWHQDDFARLFCERLTRRQRAGLSVVTDSPDAADGHPVGETHHPKRAENEVVSQPEQPS